MLKDRFYYEVKPYLPWRVRMWLRRWFARRTLQSCGDVWPINEAAGRPPEGWMGWPEGKRLALVLTHDVEGPLGLARCRQLMELDLRHGFRSAFMFVPEGEYSVPPELRTELVRNGFEVGVHDLHHDGKLYHRRRVFASHAVRINHWLKEWGAVGFRSGFMLHNLEWLHDLDAAYDASTFDTDPFEPQPDGTGTIFPFWVSSNNGDGYLELPYTLTQDSTLFLVLQHSTIDIWNQKLAWIAERGGMALLTTHPDYMTAAGCAPRRGEYPIELYEEFLRHIRQQYDGQYWHALPREVARFWTDNVSGKSRHE